jgi:hypothetical protein
MFANCHSQPLQKYINLRALPKNVCVCMRCNWHPMHKSRQLNSRLSSRIWSRSQKGSFPWIRGPLRIVWWKNRKSKITRPCPFKDFCEPVQLQYQSIFSFIWSCKRQFVQLSTFVFFCSVKGNTKVIEINERFIGVYLFLFYTCMHPTALSEKYSWDLSLS